MNLNKFVKKQSQKSTECNDPPKIDLKTFKNNELFIVSHSDTSFVDLDTADYDEEFKYKSEPQTSSTKVGKPSSFADDILNFELASTTKNEFSNILLVHTVGINDNSQILKTKPNEKKGENNFNNVNIDFTAKDEEEKLLFNSSKDEGLPDGRISNGKGVSKEKKGQNKDASEVSSSSKNERTNHKKINNGNGNEVELGSSNINSINPILKTRKASLMKKRVSFNEKVYVFSGQINYEKHPLPLRTGRKKKNCGCKFY